VYFACFTDFAILAKDTNPIDEPDKKNRKNAMTRDQAIKFMHDLLRLMLSKNGSDLFITADYPPAFKIDGKMTPVSNQKLTAQHTRELVHAVMTDKQIIEFENTKECNFAINPEGIGRFRVNAFVQQGKAGLVLNPATPLHCLEHVMDKLDIVLLMSVNPGFGGQHFIPATLQKLRDARQRIDAWTAAGGQSIALEIDGGVKVDNIAQIRAAGADTFVAGSAIFGQPDYAQVIRAMREQILLGETVCA